MHTETVLRQESGESARCYAECGDTLIATATLAACGGG